MVINMIKQIKKRNKQNIHLFYDSLNYYLVFNILDCLRIV